MFKECKYRFGCLQVSAVLYIVVELDFYKLWSFKHSGRLLEKYIGNALSSRTVLKSCVSQLPSILVLEIGVAISIYQSHICMLCSLHSTQMHLYRNRSLLDDYRLNPHIRGNVGLCKIIVRLALVFPMWSLGRPALTLLQKSAYDVSHVVTS